MLINPLANPKGVRHSCELCGKPAFIQCKSCRVTYYCDKEHESTDFRGIHEKICQLLVPLRTPVTLLGSEEERAHRDRQTKHRQLQLLELTKTEAHKILFEGKFELAIPAALQTLRFSMDVYGQDSIQLVPAYLLLGEASIGLKQFNQAEDYLSMARWAVLKVDYCDHRIKSQLHRNFGLLYASQGNHQDALHQLAQDIYFSSLVYGPEHISVTGGYFHLARVFRELNKIDNTTNIFEKIVSIWKTFLQQSPTGISALDEAQKAEAIQIISSIYQFRETQLGAGHTQTAEARSVLSKLQVTSG